MTDPRPRPDAVPTARPAGRLGIGEVVAALEAEFPGVTASKVRFLEDRGLVLPERTPAGYRRFRPEDVDRLRFVLALQRDHFLPLKVIADARAHARTIREISNWSAKPAEERRTILAALPTRKAELAARKG